LQWVIVFARLLQFSCALTLFGLPLFYLYGFRSGPSANGPRLSLALAALGAFIGAGLWVAAQAATFFPESGFFSLDAHWIVLTETRFGRVTFLREILLAAALIVMLVMPPNRTAWTLQALLGALIVASFAWIGHGGYDSGVAGLLHRSADVLHLLSSGIWIGALIALIHLILRSLQTHTKDDARVVLGALERFSGIGPAMAAVLIATGLANSWFLVGPAQWQSLFTSNYGIALTIKILLVAAMLLLAALNRYRLSPALRSSLDEGVSPFVSLGKLRRSIAAEIILSIAVLAAVALFGTWEPPIAGG